MVLRRRVVWLFLYFGSSLHFHTPFLFCISISFLYFHIHSLFCTSMSFLNFRLFFGFPFTFPATSFLEQLQRLERSRFKRTLARRCSVVIDGGAVAHVAVGIVYVLGSSRRPAVVAVVSSFSLFIRSVRENVCDFFVGGSSVISIIVIIVTADRFNVKTCR